MSLFSRIFFKSKFSVISECLGSPAMTRCLASAAQKKDDSFARIMFKLNGYCKYGLLHDDLLWETNPKIKEAIRRLPEEEQMQRLYRAIRAHQCDINHTILPPEEWTKFEDNHYYLRPYLAEILKETEEMEEWEANH